jgi:putative CRISPR-associated protein (TIGR02619 family)
MDGKMNMNSKFRMIIVTVGTSLLTNRDDRPWGGWMRNDPLPNQEVVDNWLMDSDPKKASAELNTLHTIGVDETDHLRFLHSDTPEGAFCAEILCTYARKKWGVRNADTISVASLGYEYGNFAQKGLRSLVDVALKSLKDAEKRQLTPLFCATGGFKPEIAFLNLLGALMNVEVVYMHEYFREVVRLPSLPLKWDDGYVLEREAFFQWIDSEPRRLRDAESWLKGDSSLEPLIETDKDGYIYLNAAGNLLYKTAKVKHSNEIVFRPEPSILAPKDKNHLSSIEHHRPNGWEQYIGKICDIDFVTGVFYYTAAYGEESIKTLDEEKGSIFVIYGSAGNYLPIRIETTAQGEAQTRFAMETIREIKQ